MSKDIKENLVETEILLTPLEKLRQRVADLLQEMAAENLINATGIFVYFNIEKVASLVEKILSKYSYLLTLPQRPEKVVSSNQRTNQSMRLVLTGAA